jgi:hypothetical protein
MLRWLTILVSVFLIGAFVLMVRYDEIHNTEGKGYDIKCTQSSEPSTTMSTLICTAEHSQKAQSSESSSQWWHELLAWPEGITALAIIATLFAIVWQSCLTRRAAVAAEDSIKLQEMAYKQWLELKDWKVVVSEDEKSLNVSVNLINPTNFPVALSLIKITLEFGQGVERHLIRKGRDLLPRDPVKMTADGPLSDLARPHYFESSIGILVRGKLEFVSVLKRPESQEILGMLSCGSSKTDFNYIIEENTEN